MATTSHMTPTVIATPSGRFPAVLGSNPTTEPVTATAIAGRPEGGWGTPVPGPEFVAPAPPAIILPRSASAQIGAGLRVAVAKWHAALPWAPIDPAANDPAASEGGDARRTAAWVGFPQ